MTNPPLTEDDRKAVEAIRDAATAASDIILKRYGMDRVKAHDVLVAMVAGWIRADRNCCQHHLAMGAAEFNSELAAALGLPGVPVIEVRSILHDMEPAGRA